MAPFAAENTMHGYRRCLEPPVSTSCLEVDVRCTADGEYVLLHDATLDRTTNATGPVCEMTSRDLHSVDAGPAVGQFHSVPLLAAAVELMELHTGVIFMIDIKSFEACEGVMEAVALMSTGLRRRVLLGAVQDERTSAE